MKTGRRGLSAVFGFLVIFMLLMAGLAAISTELNAQNSVWSSQERARQVENTRQLEHLTLSLNGSFLVVRNDGLVQSQLQYLVREANQSMTDTKVQSLLQTGSTSAIPIASQASGYAVITQLGNVFWLQDPSQMLSTSVPVTFDASGLPPSFNTSAVLTVDGQPVTYSQLPKTFEWQGGSTHSFSYAAGFSVGPSERLGWAYSRGASTLRQGTLVASQPESVVSQYADQYLLAVVGGGAIGYLGSPGNDGWYPAGSTAQVSTSYSWNLTSGQSRQNLVSWDVDGSSVVAVARSGEGTFVTSGIVMDAPHTQYLNSVTQYRVYTNTSVPAAGALPSLSLGYAYQGLASSSWSCSAFSLSGYPGGTATQGLCPEPSSSQDVTSVAWSVAVSSSGTLGDTLSFYVAVNGCYSQSYDATAGSSGSFSGCMPVTGASIVLQWRVSPGCWSKRIQDYIYCGTTFSVASSGTYTYVSSVSGSTQTAAASFSSSGASVEYNYAFEYSFPPGSVSTSLALTFPASEVLGSVTSPCGTWTASANTITIANACSSQSLLSTSATGSYSVSLGASPTSDGWYDAGTSHTISATSSGPFVFFGWGVSTPGLQVASGTAQSTAVVVGSAGTITAVFNVVE
ncbi:MAG: hypothetical protein LYZ69_02335 [Nitrososphaerales archaeon]|nr:hypothetical protein [Nitrososphaerales archaeon]